MNQVEQSVAEYVDEVWEDVVADIEQLVSYPSVAVAADAEPGAPFGRPVRDALDCALGIAQKLGYQTSDDEGFVGIADIPGRGDKQLATICHVDVVPVGTAGRPTPSPCAFRTAGCWAAALPTTKAPWWLPCTP